MTRILVARTQDCDPNLALPSYETSLAAGADIRANLPQGPMTLDPGARQVIPTGLRFEIPPGFEVQIRPRSGLARKRGVTLVNAPGTVDADYRGEVGVLLINLGQEPVTFNHGDRIAQLVVAPVVQADFAAVDTLSDTDRGAGGFGSTGVAS